MTIYSGLRQCAVRRWRVVESEIVNGEVGRSRLAS